MNADLIGATIEVVHANNKTLIGKKGKVVDETKNTITINTKEKKTKNTENTHHIQNSQRQKI